MAKIRLVPLLILWLLGYVTANVELPANVTLHCHNLENFVEWSYSHQKPGLQFKIEVHTTKSGDINPIVVASPTSRADLPSLPDITDSYFVTVTALFGQEESGPAPPDGIEFSYYSDVVEKKCILDIPSVNVTAKEDGQVLVSFTHPWILYRDRFPSSGKKNKGKRSHQASVNLPEFKYDVEITNQKVPAKRLHCSQSQCEGSILGKAGQEERCLTISGNMEKMHFKTTQEYCAAPPKLLQLNNYTYVLIIAISLLLALALGLFMVYWKCTSPSSPLPTSMLFRSPLTQFNFKEVRETVCVPEQEPSSPTPLLPNTQETSVTPTTEQELRLPIGVPTTEEDVCDVKKDEDGYMDGHDLEDEEQDSSGPVSNGYEKRTCIVSLGSDEEAEGYRGRNAD